MKHGDVEMLKKSFDEYDKDKSGSISLAEFKLELQNKKNASAGRPGMQTTLAQRQAAAGVSLLDLSDGVFSEMDTNADGDVSFKELLKLMYPNAGEEDLELMDSWVRPPPAPEPEAAAALAPCRRCHGRGPAAARGSRSSTEP